jgi:hypothetical protein
MVHEMAGLENASSSSGCCAEVYDEEGKVASTGEVVRGG